jgi:uncharacterized sulfatase
LTLVAALLFALATVDPAVAQPPPNVVLIIGDDIGWTDFGFMESFRTLQTNQGELPIQDVVQTPNLDAIAASGVLFRNGHATASVCRASLRTLLSAGGLHSFQWTAMEQTLEAVPGIGPIPVRAESQYYRTLPRELGRLGCKSWEGGKMWEGTYEMAGFTHGLATEIGSIFRSVGDEFGRTDWNTASCGSTGAPGVPCPALAPFRQFLDGLDGECFFAWIAPTLPHLPYSAPEIYRAPYQALGLQSYEVGYLANVTWLDQVVGEVLEELDERGLRDETLIVYVSDNGWGLGLQFVPGSGRGKGTLYDVGFRTPVILHWPGHVPAGAVYDDLVSIADVVPTIYDYVGADEPPGQQGMSLRPRIEGGSPLGRTEVIGFHEGLGHFLRDDTWRYLRFLGDGHEELYRIDLDPYEQVDLAADHPELVASFGALVDEWMIERQTPGDRIEISGKLVSRTTGQPLVGSKLWIAGTRLNAIAGADGSFRIGPLPADLYLLGGQPRLSGLEGLGSSTFIPLPPGLVAGGLHLPLIADDPPAVPGNFTGRIEGTLQHPLGQPVAGETVKASGRVGGRIVAVYALTQPDGSYRIENLPAGNYRVTATVPRGHRRVAVPQVAVADGATVELDLVAERR